jgi:hypothetical protein
MIIALCSNSYADVSSAAVLFLRIAAGARAAGMGEAFVAIADDATASHWNPAGMGQYPLASTWFEIKIPDELRPLRKIALFKGHTSDLGFKKYDIWALSAKGLVKYSDGEWIYNDIIYAKPDQTAESILRQYTGLFGEASDEIIPTLLEKMGRANNKYSIEKIDSLENRIMGTIPGDYKSRDDLENAFIALKKAYNECLIDWDRVDLVSSLFYKNIKDSLLDDFQADKILLAVEKAKRRFLPEEITIPIDINIQGEINDIAADEKFLWLATESGVYRYLGSSWQKFGIDEGLPTLGIKKVKLFGKMVFLSTDTGLVVYKAGAFTYYGQEQGLPHKPVNGIAIDGPNRAWVVIDGDLYQFNGTVWKNYIELSGMHEFSIETIYEKMKIYNNPREKEKYISKLKMLNPGLKDIPTVPIEIDSSKSSGAIENFRDLIDSAGVITAIQQFQDTLGLKPLDTVPLSAEVDTLSDLVDSAGISDALRAMFSKSDDEPSETDTTQQKAPVAGVSGDVLRIPFTAGIDFDILDMEVDSRGSIWIGTEYGVIEFRGHRWKRWGYYDNLLTVEKDITLFDLALKQKRIRGDSTKAMKLAKITKIANHLESDTLKAGEKINMYHDSRGNKINDILIRGDRIIFATVEGTIYLLDGIYWDRYHAHGLGNKNTYMVEKKDRDTWFVTRDKIEIHASGRQEITAMHVSWLKQLADDMYYEYLGYTQNVEGWGTVGGNITFLTFGELMRTGETGEDLGTFSAFDVAMTISFGTPLTSTLSGGISAKVIYSNLSKEYGAGKEKGEGTSTGLALDIGLLYKIDPRLTLGMALTNLGPDMAYIDVEQADPLPRNLAVGLAWKMLKSEYNEITLTVEANKSLAERDKTILEESKEVVADPQNELKGLVFNPFTSGGMTRAFKGVIINSGMEYRYSSFFFLRAGYIHDEEGDIKTPTLGFGLSYSHFGFDFAYIPSSKDLPLANTMRFSLSVGW